MKKVIFTKLLITLSLFISQPLYAHFHYDLDTTTMLQLNKSDQLHELKVSWIYNDEVSAMMLEGNEDLTALGKALINDLAKLNYFIHVKLNGKTLAINKVSRYHLERIKQDGHTRLKLNLSLPLKQAISLKGKSLLSLNYSDSTGSAMLYHHDAKHIIIAKSPASQAQINCKTNIINKENSGHGEAVQRVELSCNMQ